MSMPIRRRILSLSLVILAAIGLSSFRPYPRVPAEPWRHSAAATRRPAAIAFPEPTVLKHSHNDYEQAHPLTDALGQGYESIEADVWWHGGEILVSHLGYSFTGRLDELYLNPLQELVRRQGSLYGDGRPVLLWLDIKDRRPQFVGALRALLAHYPMLTRYVRDADRAPTAAPVTVVLTGHAGAKRAYVRDARHLDAFRDDGAFDESDEPVRGPSDPWQWYSLNWFRYVDWDGEGEIDAGEAARLRRLVDAIHAKGRRLRFWGAPNTAGVWRASLEAGVDAIGADDLPGLADFLRRWGDLRS